MVGYAAEVARSAVGRRRCTEPANPSMRIMLGMELSQRQNSPWLQVGQPPQGTPLASSGGEKRLSREPSKLGQRSTIERVSIRPNAMRECSPVSRMANPRASWYCEFGCLKATPRMRHVQLENSTRSRSFLKQRELELLKRFDAVAGNKTGYGSRGSTLLQS